MGVTIHTLNTYVSRLTCWGVIVHTPVLMLNVVSEGDEKVAAGHRAREARKWPRGSSSRWTEFSWKSFNLHVKIILIDQLCHMRCF